MRKIVYLMAHALMAFVFLLALNSPAMAIEAEFEANKNYRIYEVEGWHVVAADDDLSTSATLLTEMDTAYAQLSAEDEVEILSSDALDITQTVTIVGINNSGNKATEDIVLNTADGTTVVAGTTVWRYIETATVDKECVGAITIQKQGDPNKDVDIIIIPIGQLNGQVSQHFNGEDVTYVTYWACGVNTTTGNVTFTLRWYPDDADCLDADEGFITLDTIYIDAAVTSPYNVVHNYSLPIKLPAGGWLSVWAVGSADNADGYTILQGYDSSRYK